MKTGDVSSELAVDGAGDPIWIGRSRPLNPEKGERAIANPNSGLVWTMVQHDRNGDGKFDFDERLHRSVSNVAIKDDLLIAADFPWGWSTVSTPRPADSIRTFDNALSRICLTADCRWCRVCRR